MPPVMAQTRTRGESLARARSRCCGAAVTFERAPITSPVSGRIVGRCEACRQVEPSPYAITLDEVPVIVLDVTPEGREATRRASFSSNLHERIERGRLVSRQCLYCGETYEYEWHGGQERKYCAPKHRLAHLKMKAASL